MTTTNSLGQLIKATDIERITLTIDGKTLRFLGRVTKSKVSGTLVVRKLNGDGGTVLSSKIETIGGVETEVEKEQIFIVPEASIKKRQKLVVNLHYGEFEAAP